MFKKTVVAITILLLFMTGFVSLEAQAAEITTTFASVVAPDHPNYLGAVRFAELVEERTEGRVKVNTYPAAQLGNERDIIEGLKMGTVDFILASPGAVSMFQSEYGVFDCPYIFRDFEHMIAVQNSEIQAELNEKLIENHGIMELVSDWAYGTRHLTTADTPIYEPADLEGMLIRAPEQEIYLEAVRAMGATPTPVDFSDLYMALRQGTVDGQENPIPTIYTYKYYEAQDYIMLTGHMIRSNTALVNVDWFTSLDEDIQDYPGGHGRS